MPLPDYRSGGKEHADLSLWSPVWHACKLASRPVHRWRIRSYFAAAAVLLLAGQPVPASWQPSGPELSQGLLQGQALSQVPLPIECTSCNGSALLCDKRYNEVVFPTTHGAMSCRDEHWLAANQKYNIGHQLADGVRALMLEVHYLFGKVYLARGSALVNRKPLAEGLGEVRTFMDSHPCEVITLILKSRVRASDIALALQQAGLSDALYAHAPGQPFPTLKEMVATRRRLVIFADHEGGAYPWYHSLAEFCDQTPVKARQPEDLTGRVEHSGEEKPLCILNHYLAAPLASPALSMQVNYNPFFQQRCENFVRETRHTPNFVVVDYYHLGALFEVVDTLNGLPWPQRRQSKPRPDVEAAGNQNTADYPDTGEPLNADQPTTLQPVVQPPQ